MQACFNGHEKLVELLVTAGAKVDLQSKVTYAKKNKFSYVYNLS